MKEKTPLKYFSRHGRSGGGGDGSSSSVVSRGVKSNKGGGHGGIITPKSIFSSSARPTTQKTPGGDVRIRSSSTPAAKSRIKQKLRTFTQQHTLIVPALFDKGANILAANNNNLSSDNGSRNGKPSSQTTCYDSRDEDSSAIRDGSGTKEKDLHTSSDFKEYDTEEKSATRKGGSGLMVETQEEKNQPEEYPRHSSGLDIGDEELIVYGVKSANDPVFDSKCPTENFNPKSCSAATQVSGFEVVNAEKFNKLHQLEQAAMQLLNFPEQEMPIHKILQPLQHQEETQLERTSQCHYPPSEDLIYVAEVDADSAARAGPQRSFKLCKIDPKLATSAICSPVPPQTKEKDLSRQMLQPKVYIEGMRESLSPKTGYGDCASVAATNCSSIGTAVTAKIGNESAKIQQKNKSRSTHLDVKNSMYVPPVSYVGVAPTNLQALGLITRSGNSGSEGFLKKKQLLVAAMDTTEVIGSSKPETTKNKESQAMSSKYNVCSQSSGIADTSAPTSIAFVSDWFLIKKHDQVGQQIERVWESIVTTYDKICDEICLSAQYNATLVGEVMNSKSATVSAWTSNMVAATSAEKGTCEQQQAGALLHGDDDNNGHDVVPLAFKVRTENGKQSISIDIDWIALENFFVIPWSKKESIPMSSCVKEAKKTKLIMDQPVDSDGELLQAIGKAQTDSEIQYDSWVAPPSQMRQQKMPRARNSTFEKQAAAGEVQDVVSSISNIVVRSIHQPTEEQLKSSNKNASALVSTRCHHNKIPLKYPTSYMTLAENWVASMLVINKTLSVDAGGTLSEDLTNAGGLVGKCESRVYNNDYCCIEDHWSRGGTFTFQETDISLAGKSNGGLSMEENTALVPWDPVKHYSATRRNVTMSFDSSVVADAGAELPVLTPSVEVKLADDRDEANIVSLRSSESKKADYMRAASSPL